MKFLIKEGANPNYLASVCKIGATFPIEGADKIQKTVVNGYDMVISKSIKEGDIVIYFPIESAICEGFLSANNLYESSEWERNANAPEILKLKEKVEKLQREGTTYVTTSVPMTDGSRGELKVATTDPNKNQTEIDAINAEIKSKVGFFNKRGRVRMITLRGCPSLGFIAGTDALVNFLPKLAGTNWEELVGTQFNYIDDNEICWKYIPPIKVSSERDSQRNYKKRLKKVKKFDRIIPDTFVPHYDTQKLNEHMNALSPDDVVTITVKEHGTSIILANIPVRKKLSTWEKIKKFIGFKVAETEYDSIYSSRSVIKNQYLNPNAQSFYEKDIWGCVNRDFGQFIPKDTTIYGEVVGYIEGSDKMIQKDHDYGCKVGEWKFTPYRIVSHLDDGGKYEWNVAEVLSWTMKLCQEHPEVVGKVLPIQMLYHGKLADLYPDIDTATHWHENVLERMKNDKAGFGMELKEPLCHLYETEALNAKAILDAAIANGESQKTIKKFTTEYNKWESKRAPREGVVIRKDNDPKAEAWKLKTNAHYNREAVQHDAGEVDIEETA